MATLLLVVIYIAFIGLGIPDSLFGTAWPAIYAEWSLPLSYGSTVTTMISAGTILSSVISGRLIARLGTNRVSAYSTLCTAVALLAMAFAPNIWVMCLLGIVLGVGAGAIDVALNDYVALHYSAAHMSFLHCFYGVGVSVSPYILSLVIQSDSGWRGGYRLTFLIQIAITALLFVTLPIWHKVHPPQASAGDTDGGKTLSFAQTLKLPGMKAVCGLFFTSCGIEYICGNWGSTFLVEYKQFSTEQAARVIMLYYVGITLGRLLSGLVAKFWHSWRIIAAGQVALGVAAVLIFCPGPSALSVVGLFLAGLGNGPMFPNLNHLTPEHFGTEYSQSAMGTQMATAYVGILVAPLVCGAVGQAVGMWVFPLFVGGLFALMMVFTARTRRFIRKKSAAK